MRATIDETCMLTAEIWANRSTCPKRHVGVCITTPDGRVLAVGYNGAPRGMAHCDEVGCYLDARDECTNAIHAEANSIAIAARIGISLSGAIMYSTCFPCSRCAQLIGAVGIAQVIYAQARPGNLRDVIRAEEILQTAGVILRQLGGTSHETD